MWGKGCPTAFCTLNGYFLCDRDGIFGKRFGLGMFLECIYKVVVGSCRFVYHHAITNSQMLEFRCGMNFLHLRLTYYRHPPNYVFTTPSHPYTRSPFASGHPSPYLQCSSRSPSPETKSSARHLRPRHPLPQLLAADPPCLPPLLP